MDGKLIAGHVNSVEGIDFAGHNDGKKPKQNLVQILANLGGPFLWQFSVDNVVDDRIDWDVCNLGMILLLDNIQKSFDDAGVHCIPWDPD